MKKVIITGASSGLGLEVGKLLKDKGVEVVNVSRNSSEFEDIKTDLANNNDIENTIKTIKEKHTDFDILILNAGIMPPEELGNIDFDIDNMFKINITSSIKIVTDLFGLIKKNHADIVFVGSVSSLEGTHDHAAYCSTKHAIEGFIKSLRDGLKKEDVRVIGFHPGGFNSNIRGEGVIREGYMESKDLALLLIKLIELPRKMEVSEIVINRKRT